MEIKRHHIVALVVLQVLMRIVWVLEVWPRRPTGYITVQQTLLCPSPDVWALLAAHPTLVEALRCRRLPPGVRVLRAADRTLEPPGVWRLYLYDAIDAGVLDGGWGRSIDFRMPDGSAIIDATMA